MKIRIGVRKAGSKRHLNDPDTETKNRMTAQKTKTLAILGCFWSIILGGIVILLSAWIFWDYITTPTETQIMTSDSPNEKNRIEFFKIDGFPDPILKIKYDNRYIIKQNILPTPDRISVKWKNDQEATITLDGKGNEPDVEEIKFK